MQKLFQDWPGDRCARRQFGKPGVDRQQFLRSGGLHPALHVAAERLRDNLAPLRVDKGGKRGDFGRRGVGDGLKGIQAQDLRSDRVGENLCHRHPHAQPGKGAWSDGHGNQFDGVGLPADGFQQGLHGGSERGGAALL